jgi:hypothetical protein
MISNETGLEATIRAKPRNLSLPNRPLNGCNPPSIDGIAFGNNKSFPWNKDFSIPNCANSKGKSAGFELSFDALRTILRASADSEQQLRLE